MVESNYRCYRAITARHHRQNLRQTIVKVWYFTVECWRFCCHWPPNEVFPSGDAPCHAHSAKLPLPGRYVKCRSPRFLFPKLPVSHDPLNTVQRKAEATPASQLPGFSASSTIVSRRFEILHDL